MTLKMTIFEVKFYSFAKQGSETPTMNDLKIGAIEIDLCMQRG